MDMVINEISVERRHILNGKATGEECPIALSINENLSDGYYAEVGTLRINICDKYNMVTEAQGTKLVSRHAIVGVAETPDEASLFIEAFDGGEEVQPITFKLAMPFDKFSRVWKKP